MSQAKKPVKQTADPAAQNAETEAKELTPAQRWEAEKGGLSNRVKQLKEQQAYLLGRRTLIDRELEQVENEIRQHSFAMQGGDFVSSVYEEKDEEKKE